MVGQGNTASEEEPCQEKEIKVKMMSKIRGFFWFVFWRFFLEGLHGAL